MDNNFKNNKEKDTESEYFDLDLQNLIKKYEKKMKQIQILCNIIFVFIISYFLFCFFNNYNYSDKKEEIVAAKIIKMEESMHYSELTLLYDHHPYKVNVSHDEYDAINKLDSDKIAVNLVTKYDEYGDVKSKYIKEVYVDLNIDNFEMEEK